jgi:peptidoglycan/xylan/chitin deacetylase (PgdA/CDA1 family)
MSVEEWKEVYNLLRSFAAKLTVGVTAGWVERNGTITIFPEKFSKVAKVLKDGLNEGLLEIANHGLTHCVVGKHLPRLFSSNRQYHREFWESIPREIHFDHLDQSQSILQDYFETRITTLIPPGNVFSQDTIDAAQQNGIKRINCLNVGPSNGEINIIGNESVIDFHDREIVLEGVEWLKRKLESLPEDTEFVFVKEL